MAMCKVDSKQQLLKMIEYRNMRKPRLSMISSPGGLECKVVLYLTSDTENPVVQTLYAPPHGCDYHTEQIACRMAAQFLRDYYIHDTDFQNFIINHVYVADPFILEYEYHDVSGKMHDMERKNDWLEKEIANLRLAIAKLNEERHIFQSHQMLGPDIAFKKLTDGVVDLRHKILKMQNSEQTTLKIIGDTMENLAKLEENICTNI